MAGLQFPVQESIWDGFPWRSGTEVVLSSKIEKPTIPAASTGVIDPEKVEKYLRKEYLPTISDEVPLSQRHKVVSKVWMGFPENVRETLQTDSEQGDWFLMKEGGGLDLMLQALREKYIVHETFLEEEKRELYEISCRVDGQSVKEYYVKFQSAHHALKSPPASETSGSDYIKKCGFRPKLRREIRMKLIENGVLNMHLSRVVHIVNLAYGTYREKPDFRSLSSYS